MNCSKSELQHLGGLDVDSYSFYFFYFQNRLIFLKNCHFKAQSFSNSVRHQTNRLLQCPFPSTLLLFLKEQINPLEVLEVL